MSNKTLYCFDILILCLSLYGLVFGIIGILNSGSFIWVIPKIIVGALGVSASLLSLLRDKRISILFQLWFVLQCIIVTERVYSSENKDFVEFIFFDASPIRLGFGFDWTLANDTMLNVQLNLFYFVMAILYEKLVRNSTNPMAEP